MLNDGMALAARPFHLELEAMQSMGHLGSCMTQRFSGLEMPVLGSKDRAHNNSGDGDRNSPDELPVLQIKGPDRLGVSDRPWPYDVLKGRTAEHSFHWCLTKLTRQQFCKLETKRTLKLG